MAPGKQTGVRPGDATRLGSLVKRTGRMPGVERRPIARIQVAYGAERGQRGDIDKGIIGHVGLSSEGYGYRRPGEGQMEAYHIDRFGSVDGVVLRSSEDLRPGPKGTRPLQKRSWRRCITWSMPRHRKRIPHRRSTAGGLGLSRRGTEVGCWQKRGARSGGRGLRLAQSYSARVRRENPSCPHRNRKFA
jgi:hypothetical protein